MVESAYVRYIYYYRCRDIGGKRYFAGPKFKSLTCKHERLFDLLTLASLYQNQLIHSHQLIAPRQQLICDL